MSNDPGPWQPQRSTPIPGAPEPLVAPPGFDSPPPTPAQYIQGVSGAPAPPTHQAPPQFPSGPPFQMPQTSPYQPAKRRRGGGLIAVLVVLLVIGGITASVFWMVDTAEEKVRDAVDSVNEPFVLELSDSDRTALGLTGGERFAWQGGAPAALARVFEAATPGDPTQFTELSFYTEYAFATVQDPTDPVRLDEYEWRDGATKPPTPEPNDDEAPLKVFTLADVDLAAISVVMNDIVRVAGVEDGQVSYVGISRDTFTEGSPVVVRVYVNGPRDSKVVVLAPDGTVLKTF